MKLFGWNECNIIEFYLPIIMIKTFIMYPARILKGFGGWLGWDWQSVRSGDANRTASCDAATDGTELDITLFSCKTR